MCIVVTHNITKMFNLKWFIVNENVDPSEYPNNNHIKLILYPYNTPNYTLTKL